MARAGDIRRMLGLVTASVAYSRATGRVDSARTEAAVWNADQRGLVFGYAGTDPRGLGPTLPSRLSAAKTAPDRAEVAALEEAIERARTWRDGRDYNPDDSSWVRTVDEANALEKVIASRIESARLTWKPEAPAGIIEIVRFMAYDENGVRFDRIGSRSKCVVGWVEEAGSQQPAQTDDAEEPPPPPVRRSVERAVAGAMSKDDIDAAIRELDRAVRAVPGMRS
jgi:hypothetical protein